MTLIACLALCLGACSKGGDQCQRITDKLMPVIQERLKAAGKELRPGAADEVTQRCRDGLKSGERLDEDSRCILAAVDQATVRACFNASVRSYRVESKIEGKEALYAASKKAKQAFATGQFVEDDGYVVGKAGPTPATPCCAQPDNLCADNPDEWRQSPIWAALDIRGSESKQYQLTYESTDGKSFVMTAIGDLDCDGHPTTLTVHGTLDSYGNPTTDVAK